MQREYVLWNLREAHKALDAAISDIEADPGYDAGVLDVDLRHIYWHINAAWNGREYDAAQIPMTDALYAQHISLPADLDMQAELTALATRRDAT